ncbi:hypothetical protein PAMA_020607 [Pampus argenteus]
MAGRDTGALLVGLLVLFHTWGAWAAVQVYMEDRVETFRGKTAPIACMFTLNDSIGEVVMQWFYVTRGGEKQRIYFQNSTVKFKLPDTPFADRITVNETGGTSGVVLNIADVQLSDELEFICLIRHITDGTAEGRTKLKVFVTPDRPTIEGVQTGISVTELKTSKIGTCEVKNGYPKPNITWYRNKMPLRNEPDEVKVMSSSTTESSGLFSVTSELSLKVKEEDKDAEFYCEVTYFVPGETRMTESDPINITVYYPSTAVNAWVELPKGKIKEGDSVEIHCYGNGNTPATYTIKHKAMEFNMDLNMLVLNNVTRLDSGNYQCVYLDIDTYEELYKDVTLFVNYLDPAVVMPKGSVEVAQGAELMATCNALSSLQTETVWFKDGQEFSKGHILTLKDATFDTAGTYTCVVTVPEIEEMQTSGTLHVYVQSPPEIMKPDNTEIEESFENTVDLRCHVRGFPAPNVTWSTSDGKVLKSASQQETVEGVLLSVVSFKVTSDITAFCNASNEYGTDALAFNIKARGNGVVIAVIIICILLLAILGSVLYYLYKKGKICGRSGKQDLTKEKSNKDNIVVEMKSDNTEEAVLLGVNGEKLPSDQGGEYLDVQK